MYMVYVKSKKMRSKKRRVRKTKRIRGGSSNATGAVQSNAAATANEAGTNPVVANDGSEPNLQDVDPKKKAVDMLNILKSKLPTVTEADLDEIITVLKS
jgi:hypothetical protein